MITIEQLLARLEGVKSVGPNRWKSRCPSHEDKTPSLSIRVAENDGRILLYDFGLGCSPVDICDALGLHMRDLMPPNHVYNRPEDRGTNFTNARAVDFLELIDHEARVVLTIVGTMLSKGEAIRDDEWLRLRRAVDTISRLRDTIRPAKMPKQKEKTT